MGARTPANAKTQPPPESEDAILTRRLVILSFWAIVLCLGLPVWWKTTAIYRADLPLQSMNDWAEGKVGVPVFFAPPARRSLTLLPDMPTRFPFAHCIRSGSIACSRCTTSPPHDAARSR
jgi:hypothetical protein